MAKQRIRLGEWVIPERHVVMASISLAHSSEQSFPDPAAFNPDRFLGNPPDNYAWIPYGGGIRRCIGAAFANMEMNVTLRTLLREFEFGTTYAAGERVTPAAWPLRRGAAAGRSSTGAPVASTSTSRSDAGEDVGVTPNEAVVDVGRGIELCYDQTGDPADPPDPAHRGLGAAIAFVADEFVTALADAATT